MIKKNYGWNKLKEQRLITMISDGISAGKIAMEMGITRNAAIGKAHRLGFKFTAKVGRKKMDSTDLSASAAGMRRLRIRRRVKPPVNIEPKEELPEFNPVLTPNEIERQGPGTHIIDITPFQCHWPLWNDSSPPERRMMFCGLPVWEGQSYCLDHCRIVFQPSVTRYQSWRETLVE